MWLDQDFARESVLVLQFLSVGILFSSLSSIPNNFFQGIGKPNIPATLNLIELPIYVFLMYVFIKIYGINGAAFFWMIAAGIDAIINYLIAYYKFGIVLEKNLLLILFASILIVLSVPFLLSILWIKIILSVILIALFILISWKLVLIDEEKRFLLERISSIWVKK
jgi:O-antigen/teichoic acid export membrane protein